MGVPNDTIISRFPRRRPFSEKFATSVRKRWFGPKRPPGARRAVRCRYYGANFIAHLEDEVGFEIAINRFEWRELKIMLDACRRLTPELFLDIGANVGVYSCVLARHRAVPRIIAFEPDNVNFARLLANLKSNNASEQVEVHQEAIGASPGTLHLVPADSSNRGLSHVDGDATEGSYPVPVVTLDDTLRLDGKTIAAKIDVEGYEIEVLMGAAQLFARNKGFALIEGRIDRVAGVITELMATFGWRLVERYGINMCFEKP